MTTRRPTRRTPGRPVEQIAAVLQRERRDDPEWRRKRMKVVRRHARRDWHGRPMRCEVSPYQDDPRMDRHAGKVIYDSRAVAEACARELEQAGAPRLYAMPCPRSKRGHHHLTSKPPTAT